MNQLAQIPLGPTGGFKGFGALGLEGGQNAADVFNKFLSTTLGVMTVVAFIWFLIQFFIGVIGIISSGGDKGKLEQAKAKITSSLIGLVVVVAAIFVIGVVADILGIPYLLNPGEFVKQFGETTGVGGGGGFRQSVE